MFLEKERYYTSRTGWIEVICGSMFSGKTEELIRRLNRARIARQKVEIYKPMIDTRYNADSVVSHDANKIHCTPVQSAEQIILLAGGFDVIGIDEAQFFDHGLMDVCNSLADNGSRVIVAGLDMDFKGKPFGPIPGLMAVAEYVTKVHAICMNCGNLAHYSYRLGNDERLVLLGEKDAYSPLCRSCYKTKKNQ